MSRAATRDVLVDSEALQHFLGAAVARYKQAAPDQPRTCTGVLVGVLDGGTARVEHIAIGPETGVAAQEQRTGGRELEILGSIRMYPDRPTGSALPQLSAPPAQPATAGPVNIVCRLERIAGSIGYTLEAWGTPCPDAPPAALALRISTREPVAGG